jgi:nucleoside 2-deoxyribosyltransferase
MQWLTVPWRKKVAKLLGTHLSLRVFTNQDIKPEERWQAKLIKQLENADVFIALLTPNSITDSWLLQETGAAWGLDKPIIPLVSRLDILDRFPIQLRSYPSLDLKDLNTTRGSKRFAEALDQALAESQISTSFSYAHPRP